MIKLGFMTFVLPDWEIERIVKTDFCQRQHLHLERERRHYDERPPTYTCLGSKGEPH